MRTLPLPLTSSEQALLGKEETFCCYRCSRHLVGRAQACCMGPEVLRMVTMKNDV